MAGRSAGNLRIADTSAVFAFFAASDSHHRAAVAAFEQPDAILIPAEILAETVNLISSRIGYAGARAAGDYLWSADNTEVQPSDAALLMAAWSEFEAQRGKLSFHDCLVVAACRELGAEPLSFDKGLLRAARAR